MIHQVCLAHKISWRDVDRENFKADNVEVLPLAHFAINREWRQGAREWQRLCSHTCFVVPF